MLREIPTARRMIQDLNTDSSQWNYLGESKTRGASAIHERYLVVRFHFRNDEGYSVVLVQRIGVDLARPEQPTTWVSWRPPLQDEKFELNRSVKPAWGIANLKQEIATPDLP